MTWRGYKWHNSIIWLFQLRNLESGLIRKNLSVWARLTSSPKYYYQGFTLIGAVIWRKPQEHTVISQTSKSLVCRWNQLSFFFNKKGQQINSWHRSSSIRSVCHSTEAWSRNEFVPKYLGYVVVQEQNSPLLRQRSRRR